MTSAFSINFLLLTTLISTAYSVGIFEQCAGEGFSVVPCDHGLTCFRRNKWYSNCQYSCPKNQSWECEGYMTLLPPMATPWGQCGGTEWTGPHTCPRGYACYARSAQYSQCRPINDCPSEWACYALINPKTISSGYDILAAYTKCNDVENAVCPAGTACFRNTPSYSECRPTCPQTWICQRDVVGENEQCGGDGYVGLTLCAEGLRCYTRSKQYSRCARSCPGTDWLC